MKVKCPNCGFEDEGNFCSRCGASLPKPPVVKEEAVASEAHWTAKCPVCKSGQLELAAQKKFLGLLRHNLSEKQISEWWPQDLVDWIEKR